MSLKLLLAASAMVLTSLPSSAAELSEQECAAIKNLIVASTGVVEEASNMRRLAGAMSLQLVTANVDNPVAAMQAQTDQSEKLTAAVIRQTTALHAITPIVEMCRE